MGSVSNFQAVQELTRDHAGSRQREHIASVVAIEKKVTEAIQSAVAMLNYTPGGRKDLCRKHVLPALGKLADVAGKVQATLQAELRDAANVTAKAVDSFAPPYSREPWGAAFDIELARSVREDLRIAAPLIGSARNLSDIPPELHDLARCLLRAPKQLTGITAADQNALIGSLVGADLYGEAFAAAHDARLMVINATRRLMNEAQMPFGELAQLHLDLAELVARGAGEVVGTAQLDAPNAKPIAEASSTPPLVTGDMVNDGHSEDAVA